jgi:hypothetical protein
MEYNKNASILCRVTICFVGVYGLMFFISAILITSLFGGKGFGAGADWRTWLCHIISIALALHAVIEGWPSISKIENEDQKK